jgi:hypothetical protein
LAKKKNNIMKEQLRKELKPLYEELLKNNSFSGCSAEDICTFCVRWGEHFPQEQNKILFVGKALNGGGPESKNTDVEVLFGESSKRIFDRDDQMEWICDFWGKKKGYNTKKSAFWRVIKGISHHFYPHDDWYSYVAWSNLYKRSPYSEKGNPNDAFCKEQLEFCRKILKIEIEILSPKFVVMLTSGWEKDFLYYLNDNQHTKEVCAKEWSDKYTVKCYEIKDTIFITSVHPQGKPEKKHVQTITELIDKYKTLR